MPPTQYYKYLNVEGATLTLRNRNFKHSKPSEFNDPKDLTVEMIFPEGEEAALGSIKNNFNDVILKNLDRTPTCSSARMRMQIGMLQAAFKKNPGAAAIMKEAVQKEPLSAFYNLENARQFAKGNLAELNSLLQMNRVFCVSERIDSFKMWSVYAQEHQGIALRILPNLSKDSKFKLFRKVSYRPARPPLYENGIAFLEGALFEGRDAATKRIIDNIVYTKTLDWEHETEHRLVIPVLGEKDWNLMPYHPEEIIELYLGAKIEANTAAEMIQLAKAVNPNIIIYRCYIAGDDEVRYHLEWGAM
jgi:Protein of unknown function (DUF2971)